MKKLFTVIAFSLLMTAAFAQTGTWVGVKNVRIEKKNKYCVFMVKAEYPFIEEHITSQAIREWISETLGGSYTGDLMDYQKMLEFYADEAIKEYSGPDYAGMVAELGPSERIFEFKRGYENSHIISYKIGGELYSSGAAHGMPIETATTFRKSDGRRFTWDMFTKDGLNRLKPILVKKLRTEYGDDTFFKVPDASDPEFELPDMNPYFAEGGLVFSYSPYEIAPYSEGYITVTLPLTMVKGMLNGTGLTFISAL